MNHSSNFKKSGYFVWFHAISRVLVTTITHNFSVLEKWLIISRPNRGLQFAWLAGILQSWTKVLVDKGSYANGTTTIQKFLKEFNWSHKEVHRGILRQKSNMDSQFLANWAVRALKKTSFNLSYFLVCYKYFHRQIK